jgi:hypothetical protein
MRSGKNLRSVLSTLLFTAVAVTATLAQQAPHPIDQPVVPRPGPVRPSMAPPLALPSLAPPGAGTPAPLSVPGSSRGAVPQGPPMHSTLGPGIPLGLLPQLPPQTTANTVAANTGGLRRRMNGTVASIVWNQVSNCSSTSANSTIFNIGCQIDFQLAYCNGALPTTNNCSGMGTSFSSITRTDLFQDYYINSTSATASAIDGSYTPCMVGTTTACSTSLFSAGSSSLPSDCTAASTCPYGPFHNLTLNNQGVVALASLDCGVPGPPAGATEASVTGGALAARTYYIEITFTYASGETTASPEISASVPGGSLAKVSSPASVAGATGWNVYVGTSSGTEKKQNSSTIAIGTSWTEPTSGLSSTGSAPPASQSCAGSTSWVATDYLTVQSAQAVNTYADSTRLTQASNFAIPGSGTNTIYLTISGAQYSDNYVVYVENTSVYSQCTAIIPSATSLSYPCDPRSSNAGSVQALATGPLYMQWTYGPTLTAGTYSIVAWDQTQGKRVGETQVVLTKGSAAVRFNGIGGNSNPPLASPVPNATGTPCAPSTTNTCAFAFDDTTDESDKQYYSSFSGLTSGHKYCFTIQDPTARVYQNYSNGSEAFTCSTTAGTTLNVTDTFLSYKAPLNFTSNTFSFSACDFNVGTPCTISATGSFNLFGYNAITEFTNAAGTSVTGATITVPKSSVVTAGLEFVNDGDSYYGVGNGDGLKGLYWESGTYNSGSNTISGYGFYVMLPCGAGGSYTTSCSETLYDSEGQAWNVTVTGVNGGSNEYSIIDAYPTTAGQYLAQNAYLIVPNIEYVSPPGSSNCTGTGCLNYSSILPTHGQTWSVPGSTFSGNLTYVTDGNNTTNSGTGTFVRLGVTAGCSGSTCAAYGGSTTGNAFTTVDQHGYTTSMSQALYALAEPFSPTSGQADVYKVVVTNNSSSNYIASIAFSLPNTYATASYTTTWSLDANTALNPSGNWVQDTSASCPSGSNFCIKASSSTYYIAANGGTRTFYIDVQGLPPLSMSYAEITEQVYSPVVYDLAADSSYGSRPIRVDSTGTSDTVDALALGAYSLDSGYMTPLFNPTSEGTSTSNTVNVSFKNTSTAQDTQPDYVDLVVFELPNKGPDGSTTLITSTSNFAGTSPSSWSLLGTTSGTHDSTNDTDYWFGITGCYGSNISAAYGPKDYPTTGTVNTSMPSSACSSGSEVNALGPGSTISFNTPINTGASTGTVTGYSWAHGANGNGWSKSHSFSLNVTSTSGTAGFYEAGTYGSPAIVSSNTTPQIAADSDITNCSGSTIGSFVNNKGCGNSFVYAISNTSGTGHNISSAQIMIPYQDSSGANGQDTDSTDCSAGTTGCIWAVTGAPALSGSGYTNCAVTSYTSATTATSNGYITIGNSGGTCTLSPGGTMYISFSMKGPYKINDQYGFPACLNGTWTGSGNTAACGGLKANETWVGDSYIQTTLGASVVIGVGATTNAQGNALSPACGICTFTSSSNTIDFGTLSASTTYGPYTDIALVDVYTDASTPEGWSLFVSQTSTNSTAATYLYSDVDTTSTKSYQPVSGSSYNLTSYTQIPVTSVATSGALLASSGSGTSATRKPFEYANNYKIIMGTNTTANTSSITYTFIPN